MGLFFFDRTRSSRLSGADPLVLLYRACTRRDATIFQVAIPALTLYSLNVVASFWSLWKVSSSSSKVILAACLNLLL